ncbi:RNA polymerase sigma factor [Candidatus Methylacidiphilum fumarolicum]|uniref:RNA polymerase sigma-70 factor, ECF subfamily n=2 Tax=Candidatus Methylacidiphilum fumarolicum TaxID=591154 RepID=I0K051_METFB|nr:RNA polymerase sigma factor [Candidatus Methylacidiphilum fumarolicum]MBW6414280.1 RNA polymerase sigma factor [Candidatus Methylacidiphilum fumarolicum]TFE70970.1 hypothetical protein A7K73_00140 [Candidatus Methylacidiphilum fumarolicum]TFE71366.1 RNA polymerase sigma factor [Candidatus Methylacidiphilum fumarolicum]TFE74408.1 RNA polymerase sigma factor [Candidatus Methylacidiphilum fumarolicum]TFE76857.1 hypothetical protein A7D33_07990 [Candidatus Methylacidiphilum fumarolicum]
MIKKKFKEYVEAHYVDVYRFAISLCRQVDKACDLTQQTFVLLYTNKNKIKDDSRIRNWLFTTLYRLFLRSKKREERYQYMEMEEMENFLVVEHKGEIAVDSQFVKECLMKIDEPYRIALWLYYMDELSYLDIAAILNVPIGTVMSRIFRGKKLLRDLILEKRKRKVQNPKKVSA